jgi:hypothetical protein
MAVSSELRSTLERAVVAAREVGEKASADALRILAVDRDRTTESFDQDKRRLRVGLRAEARQLGGFERLVEECAYEQWHRMLFARVLAENDLLIHPEHGVAVTLADCEEIARARGETDLWLVASEFASQMLPGIFRSDDPVLRVRLAPEGQQRLEEILAGLPREVFTSEDGLGWVYQYWQAKKKKDVNASERKIGGADIAPVTQLFTENYMVRFLLENTLGAWWASRNPESPLVKEWKYLRFDDEGEPAAGGFPGWPETVAEVTVMDPCCGSGHFLVVAFEMLRKMRMEAEGLTETEAGEAVLRDNLFGLELDPRCTQIAAFALALQAWKTGGYRPLPIPNIACSGISAAGRLEDWQRLAQGDERLETALTRLHGLFSEAGDLGSLIDPQRETDGDLLAARFEEAAPLLGRALEREAADDPAAAVFGAAAAGAARAAGLLARRYTLVVTNPPFLGRGKQHEALRRFAERLYPLARADLATCFLERSLSATHPGGTAALVTPQNWLFLPIYRRMREKLLTSLTVNVIARLGEGAFRSAQAAGAFVAVGAISHASPVEATLFFGIDAADMPSLDEKASQLKGSGSYYSQLGLTQNIDSRIVLDHVARGPYLREFAESRTGTRTADNSRLLRKFWELRELGPRWEAMQSTVEETQHYGGRDSALLWGGGAGPLQLLAKTGQASIQGREFWGGTGVCISLMRGLKATIYTGQPFDMSVGVVRPRDADLLLPLWAFCSSHDYAREVRRIDQQLKLTTATLVKVPFDVEHWQRIAAEKYPNGLPKPHSDDPTQWLFSGHPRFSQAPLQVAVARLLGYRWPRQTGSDFPDCPPLGPDGLEDLAAGDGVVCLPSVRGERPAAEHLRRLLAAAFAEEWSPSKETDLLAEVGYAGKSLELWLRDGFFEQHCQLFHQRPFIWQVWDGRKDGFSALVNYHRLDRALLERLAYTYVNDWIDRQRHAAQEGQPGSEERLLVATQLQERLKLILDGDPPYDIFVRWKPLADQPIGWEPEVDDGVRLNIRPFVTAGVLRKNPRVNWNKDRGKDREEAPWYRLFKGDRINDHHLTLAEKRAARETAVRRADAS